MRSLGQNFVEEKLPASRYIERLVPNDACTKESEYDVTPICDLRMFELLVCCTDQGFDTPEYPEKAHGGITEDDIGSIVIWLCKLLS